MPGPTESIGLALVLSENGRFQAEISLRRERLRIGRRPYNDLALDDLTVSGEHAEIQIHPEGCLIRDLDSRNGTHVNGRPITECQLAEGDCIDIGIYRLRLARATEAAAASAAPAVTTPLLEYLSGPYAGITQRVDRNLLRIGNGDAQVAVIARRRSGWFMTHLEGMAMPMVNGVAIGPAASPLADGDLIELAGAQVRFRLPG